MVGPLGRAEDVDSVFGGTADAHLGLQVKVVLAAELHLTHHALRRLVQFLCRKKKLCLIMFFVLYSDGGACWGKKIKTKKIELVT